MAVDNALCRYTLIFSDGTYGWTESYYRDENVSSIANPVQAAFQAGSWGTLVTARLYLSPPSVKLQAVRLSDPNIRGSVRLLSPNSNYNGVILGSQGAWTLQQPVAAGPAGGPYTVGFEQNVIGAETPTAIIIRLEAGTQHHRQLLLRGVPENIITPDNTYNPFATGWIPVLNAFENVLNGTSTRIRAGSGFHLKVLDKTQPELVITNFSVTGDPRYVAVSTATPIMLNGIEVVAGNKVLIRGIKNSTGVNAIWVIANVTPGVGTARNYGLGAHRSLAAWEAPPLPNLVIGYIRAAQYVGAAIDTVKDFRETRRATGRPFGLPVGRRKRR